MSLTPDDGFDACSTSIGVAGAGVVDASGHLCFWSAGVELFRLTGTADAR
jgi:hypothetical protein